MAYLLDTDWAIRALKGDRSVAADIDRLLSRRISVSRITVAELYEGAFYTVHPDAAIAGLRAFLDAYYLREITEPVAIRFAELRAYLRRRGEPLADFDLLIAATALHHDLTLLTFNRRHFARIPGLRIYEPSRT